MLNLDLVKPLPQPNWALVPFLNDPPTIAEYKTNKQKYSSEVIEAGVYRITASQFALHAWGDDLLLWRDPDYWAWRQAPIDARGQMPWKRDNRMLIRSSNYNWVQSLQEGTIKYENGIYIFTGVFEKNGSVIHFNTLHPEAFHYV